MPSLHAAVSLFVALYGASRLRSRWRWLLLLYPLTMAFTLVYYAEHYVVDILAGYVVAGLVLWGCARWEHSRAQNSPRRVTEQAIVPQQGRRSLRRSAAARRG
jgi:membrane-associated phospholipid phosphatase